MLVVNQWLTQATITKLVFILEQEHYLIRQVYITQLVKELSWDYYHQVLHKVS